MRFDQLQEDAVYRTPVVFVSHDDIVRFATEWDPQYLHLDNAKALVGPFSGIIASGMHTTALGMRSWIAEGIWGDDVLAGVRMHLRFLRPVYPNDRLWTETRIMRLRPHRIPDRGYCDIRIHVFTERSGPVLQMDVTTLVRR